MSSERRRSLILFSCCMAQFLVILDVSIVNVALPSIATALGFTAANLHWVINAYAIAFGGFLLLGGRFTDIVGRREVFTGGLVLVLVGSLIGGAAENEAMLIVARAIQGLGAAAAAPASFAILMVTFTEAAERNRAFALWGAAGATGGASGALLGGLLTDALSWRWVLLINIPVCITIAIGALVSLPRHDKSAGKRPKADVLGAVTITAAMVLLTYGIVATEQHGWGSPNVAAPLGFGLALVAAFAFIEARVATMPLVPLGVFRSRGVSGSTIAVMCLGATGFAIWLLTSLYMQNVLGVSALDVGLAFLIPSLIVAAASWLAGPLCARFGAGPVVVVGFVLQAVAFLALSRLSPDGEYWHDLFIPMCVFSVGAGVGFVALAVAAGTGVSRENSGLASGLLNAGRQLGVSLGIATLSAVAAGKTAAVEGTLGVAAALSDGYAHAFLIGAAFPLVGALVAFLMLDMRPVSRAPAPPV